MYVIGLEPAPRSKREDEEDQKEVDPSAADKFLEFKLAIR